MAEKALLDPAHRKLADIFSQRDLERLGTFTDLIWSKDEPATDDIIDPSANELSYIITGGWRHGSISRFPRLKGILEVSGAFPSPEALDYAACFERNIRVLSCAPAFAPAVAEMALGLALAAARRFVWNDADFRTGGGNWSHTDFPDPTASEGTFTLYGKKVGLIGFGGLARSLMPLLRPFGCSVQVYDPWLTDTWLRSQGVEPVAIEELLETSRFVFVLAVPAAGNRAFLDRSLLEHIRPDAVFLLMSRSHVVDFDALTDLLMAERFRAGIDVFPEEPLPLDHPIRKAPNVVFSTHRAGAISEALLNIGRIVADDVEAMTHGKVPREMQNAEPEFIRARAARQDDGV